jgi:hypothetical protein
MKPKPQRITSVSQQLYNEVAKYEFPAVLHGNNYSRWRNLMLKNQ